MNNTKSDFSKAADSVTKTIVDNVNNVLGILPKTLSFEVSMPKKTVRHRKVKAAPRRAKPSVARKAKTAAKRGLKRAKVAGARLKKRAKAAITKSRKAAPRKARAVKRTKPRSRTVIALKRKPQHASHARAA